MDQPFNNNGNNTTRRQFIKLAGVAGIGLPFISFNNFTGSSLAIVSEPADSIAASSAARWAARELGQSLVSQGIIVNNYDKIADAKTEDLVIVIATAGLPTATHLLNASGVHVPPAAEALALVPLKQNGRQILLAC